LVREDDRESDYVIMIELNVFFIVEAV